MANRAMNAKLHRARKQVREAAQLRSPNRAYILQSQSTSCAQWRQRVMV